MKPILYLLASIFLANTSLLADIQLVSPSPAWLSLAADDLARDLRQVTGESMPVNRFWSSAEISSRSIIIGSIGESVFAKWIQRAEPNAFRQIEGKSEAYIVKPLESHSNTLLIAGSDFRGAMRGIYAVSREVLGVDPTYLWTGIEPVKQFNLRWEDVRLFGDEPTFPIRGWFINDEDLLTGWIEGGGTRYIDYPHYATVVHPDAMAMVCETAVRLGYNMIIPASFLDIDNPPEERLVQEASKRGLYLSMHHIQLLGLDAFAYFNYWKERGEEPLFSFYSEPQKLEEAWRHYARRWARYPDVIWQLGLRGIGDRPMWMADPGVPQSDADRGRLISEAMALQKRIVIETTGNPKPLMSTTLWAEGAALFNEGHIKIPDDVMIIFADNSPGRVWQDDFYSTERSPKKNYGVYYHHQLWGTGPHMAQGVSPHHQYKLFKLAYENQSSDYAVLNVSSIREFVLGVSASSATLIDTPNFDPDRWLDNQCRFWFGEAGENVADAYRYFFDAYLETDRDVPYLLDGLTRSRGNRTMAAIRHMVESGEIPEPTQSETANWASRHLADMRPRLPDPGLATEFIARQHADLLAAQRKILLAELSVNKHCDATRQRFFRENLVAQWHILFGLTEWALQLEHTASAIRGNDPTQAFLHAERALAAWDHIEKGQGIVTANPRWQHWYRGDTKMNLAQVKRSTVELLDVLALDANP